MNHPALDDLRALEPNWDSYGAATISEAALTTASYLCFVPTVNGGIQIELHAGGMDIEVEIDPEGLIETVLVAPERRKQAS